MLQAPVTLPTQPQSTQATLYYMQDFTNGNNVFDVLQGIRKLSLYAKIALWDTLEERYWNDLNHNRKDFAADCSQAIGQIDLIIDPPSTRGLHRPYLSAFKQPYKSVPWISLKKTAPIDVDAQKLDELRNVVDWGADSRNDPHRGALNLSSASHVLIVDDVFSSGSTAAVIVEFIRSRGVPSGAVYYVAAPLRIPIGMQRGHVETFTEADLPQD